MLRRSESLDSDDFKIEIAGGSIAGDLSSVKEDNRWQQNGSQQQGGHCETLTDLEIQLDHSDDSGEFAGSEPVFEQSIRFQR